MYLSRLRLNERSRKSLFVLGNPNRLHGAICQCWFEREHCLWRLDRLYGSLYLLILSDKKPDFGPLREQVGFPGEEPRTVEYERLLKRIVSGGTWHFRLVANPTFCRTQYADDGRHTRGKVCAHVTAEQQKLWLFEKAEHLGFQLGYDEFDLTARDLLVFHKGGMSKKRVTLSVAEFEGNLTVTDAEVFRNTLLQGIGRGKAYGMGLLTVASR